ncbi:hypothetical protein VTK26DRAFT_561 [Humicola hyalothermophila]
MSRFLQNDPSPCVSNIQGVPGSHPTTNTPTGAARDRDPLLCRSIGCRKNEHQPKPPIMPAVESEICPQSSPATPSPSVSHANATTSPWSSGFPAYAQPASSWTWADPVFEVPRRMGLRDTFLATAAPEQGIQVVNRTGRRCAYLPDQQARLGQKAEEDEGEARRTAPLAQQCCRTWAPHAPWRASTS